MYPEVGDTRAGGNRGRMVKTADSWPASSVVPVLLGAWERERASSEVRGTLAEGTNQLITWYQPYDAQQLLPENFGHPSISTQIHFQPVLQQ